MENNKNLPCNHRYIVGYSFRMPQPFFRNLPCDNCGCRIRLSWPWRLVYELVEILGFIVAYLISASVHIELFGSTLFISILIFILAIQLFQLPNRLVLKYGKWVESGAK
mgnify:CR=1 FL=1